MKTKICNRCGREFPATTEYFKSDNRKKYGISNPCLNCYSDYRKTIRNTPEGREITAAYSRKWRKENPEKNAARNRRWRARHPEVAREIDRRERQKNNEYYKEYRKKYYQENKSQVDANNETWRIANRDKWNSASRVRCRNRRASIKNAEGTHTAQDIDRIYKSQKGKCYWCNKKVGKHYHVDHVIPLSRGGSNDPSNLVIACHSCNESKGGKLPHEWSKSDKLL